MSIRSTLILATAIATLGVQVGLAFAEGYSPCTGNGSSDIA